MGQLGITESLGSWELLFGIAKMRDGGGPDQEKWAAGKEYSFEESTVKQEKDNTCPSTSARATKGKTRQVQQNKKENGKRERKEKGNVWTSQNEMTIIQVLSKA